MNVLNGNGSGCCPLSWSAAWKEGLNVLKLWREMKSIFRASAGAICKKWTLVAFKRWKYAAQIDSYLQKRTQCFESQSEWKLHMFRWYRKVRSIEDMTCLHHFSDNLGISLVSIWEHRIMQCWELTLFALCWGLKASENKSSSFVKLGL